MKISEEKIEYIDYIKDEFYTHTEFPRSCKLEIMRPKFPDLMFGFITSPKKKMSVLDLETNILLEM